MHASHVDVVNFGRFGRISAIAESVIRLHRNERHVEPEVADVEVDVCVDRLFKNCCAVALVFEVRCVGKISVIEAVRFEFGQHNGRIGNKRRMFSYGNEFCIAIIKA